MLLILALHCLSGGYVDAAVFDKLFSMKWRDSYLLKYDRSDDTITCLLSVTDVLASLTLENINKSYNIWRVGTT